MTSFSEQIDKECQRRIATIKQSVVRLAQVLFPEGDHALTASVRRRERQVATLEDWLLDSEQQQILALNAQNRFYLYAAAYLTALVPLRLASSPEDGESSAVHPLEGPSPAIGVGTLIRERWRDLGLRDPAEASDLAVICEAAAPEERSVDAPSVDDGETSDAAVNRTLLAAGLRLARALDLSGDSVQRDIHRCLPDGVNLNRNQLAEWFDVADFGPHRLVPATIQLTIACRHAEVHRALKAYETKVQRLLGRLNRRASPRFLFSDCRFEIIPRGYDPVDLKFTVDSSAALHLFTGNRLYADRRAFLRELLQNAIDACHLRGLVDKDYQPAITIRFQDDIRIVSVADNGIGMDRQWIEKYFLQIGISFYQSGRIRRINHDRGIGLSFISQFGIGFLSSFLVAEKIIIRTRRLGSPGLQITIRDLKDYFDIRLLDEAMPVGTEVCLHLKPSRARYCRSLEYIGYLKTNIRFLKVPVELVDESGRTIAIGREALAYPEDTRRGTAFVAALDLPASEGYLLLQAKKQTSYIQGLEPAHGGVSVFQDGIFVTQVETLLPEGARQHVIGRVNLEGADKCELSMDRNRIFWSEERLAAIKRALRLSLVDVVRRFAAAVEAQEAPEATRTGIFNQLAVFFDFNEVDDGMHARLPPAIRDRIEKRFRDFIRIHFAHAVKTVGRPVADGYNEAWQQAILDSFVNRRRG
ncbi:MAG: ATP-binding protein [Desulfobacterales bacterium]|nr:ATP-binding protein [Desulfobacterales bacterium]